MPAADDDDEVVRRRLAGLGLAPRGWVPDQSGEWFAPVADAPAAPVMAGTPVAPTRLGAPWLEELVAGVTPRMTLALVVVCALCLSVTGWALLRHRSESPLPPAPVSAAAPLPAPTPAGIVVDVGGRVRRPGLVTLPVGSRVADAVRAAGGAVGARDLLLVDLAAKVSDGQLLLIGVTGSGAAGPAAGPGVPLNLNTATVDALDALPGIGPVLAQRIVDWRDAHGGFRSVHDLDEVSGIGDSIYAEISPLVTV